MRKFNSGTEERTSIRKRLFILTLISAFLPILMYGIINLMSYVQILTHTTQERLQKIGTRAGNETQMYVLHTFEILNTLIESITGAMLTPDQVEVMVKNYAVNFPQLRDLVVEWNGKRIKAIGEAPEDIHLDAVGEGRFISSLVFDPVAAIPIIYVATESRDPISGNIRITASLNLMNVWKTLRDIEADTGLTFILLDHNYNVIGYSRPNRNAQAVIFKRKQVKKLVDRLEMKPFSFITEPDGTFSMALYVPMKKIKWAVIATFPIFKGVRENASMILKIIAIVLASLFFIYLASSYHAGLITGAVNQLEKATQEVRKENFRYRVRINTRDELEDLAGAFNLMNEKIEQLIEEIKEKERRLTFVRLIRGILHDLKHPFRGIKSIVSSADLGQWGTLIQEYIEDAEDFLEDLNTLAREEIEMPLLSIQPESVVGDVLNVYRPQAEKKGVSLDMEVIDHFCVRGSPQHLKRVLSNVVENALNATEKGGKIMVTVKRSDSTRGVIEIADTGCGIPPEHLSRVFEWEFSTRSRGLGLGLPVSKFLVENMGGKIEISSIVGEGTKVRIYLIIEEEQIGRET